MKWIFFYRFPLSKSAENQVHNFMKHKIISKSKSSSFNKNKSTFNTKVSRYWILLKKCGRFLWCQFTNSSRIVKKVTEAIAQLRPVIIKFPGAVQDGFYKIARFPMVIGALDCSHVIVKSPGGDLAENFRNRKDNFAINVQVVCDSQLKCLDIVARFL